MWDFGLSFERFFYQGVETGAEVVGSDEDVVGSSGAVPERVLGGDEVDGGGYKRARVANCRKAINGAEVA
uniref:Uncharacterized protein n=1 Tax=Cajanus cajan TaxID=3821 RepID=A0A151SAG3_CAJCA|nr:hypothetical protein KK1_026315 [Cajanus cajan]